jgi:hypothetical protein
MSRKPDPRGRRGGQPNAAAAQERYRNRLGGKKVQARVKT